MEEELRPYNVTQVPPVIETEDIQLEKYTIEKENQGSELDVRIGNVLEEALHVTNIKVYFVKLWPNLEARIREAEKLIEKFNQDLSDISRKLEERTRNQRELIYRLKWLNYDDERYRVSLTLKREELNCLQLTLDKLCFANNAYRVRPIKSRASKGGELDIHKLHFRVLHGRNNLAVEKQLIKEINGSQQKTISSSCFPLKELKDAIFAFHCNERWTLGWPSREPKGDRAEQIESERKELFCLKERAIANAPVKGKLWNSLGSKQAIQDQVNVRRTELNEAKKNLLPVRAKAKHAQKELEKIEKDIELGTEGSGYYQYQSLIENGRKLTRKKDVAALEELSREQVDRFTSQWNSNKAFRNEYEKRFYHHLDGLQPSEEQQMRNSGMKPLVSDGLENIKTEQ
ncbi:proton pump-interactor BIP131-like [Juglans microcarpa x Juglans regia]|uniref:proton pump-interactor BIP131-like n=1 Tax=Juglans microcarpa x Juglans regia TaxID=2249226 RepID=UPI001B7F111A|nr:proton pump-interactor BIP131-like [Juglans microcarpa x Juglans regia]